MDELHLTNVSILHDMNCPLKIESKDIVCGGAEHHVYKVILVISLKRGSTQK